MKTGLPQIAFALIILASGCRIAICNAGTIERFDCLQLGFKGCTESRRARCEWEFDF
jgi:hypothetical protein